MGGIVTTISGPTRACYVWMITDRPNCKGKGQYGSLVCKFRDGAVHEKDFPPAL
jgi:hypothetical protein